MDRLRSLTSAPNSINFLTDSRILTLSNGIRALIISDPSPINEHKDEENNHKQDGKSSQHNISSASTLNDEESEDETDDAGDSDSEEEESCNGGIKEKLAACSVCVDVG